jgi:hypothetical protein
VRVYGGVAGGSRKARQCDDKVTVQFRQKTKEEASLAQARQICKTCERDKLVLLESAKIGAY